MFRSIEQRRRVHRRRLLGGWVAAGLVLFDPALAAAQDDDSVPDISEIKLVVPRARGKKSWGRDTLTQSLRKHLAEGVNLISHRQFLRQRKKLRIRSSAVFRSENLAKVGRAIDAQFVLAVVIKRQRWLYTATARLIDTETGAEKMNFRSQYYKPGAEAEDRGFRIARRTLQKLGTLLDANEVPEWLPSGKMNRRRPTRSPSLPSRRRQPPQPSVSLRERDQRLRQRAVRAGRRRAPRFHHEPTGRRRAPAG